MHTLARLTRMFVLYTAVFTLTGCCCCDPEMLGEFGDGLGEGFEKELEAKMKEEAAKLEAQAIEMEAEAAQQADEARMMAELDEVKVEAKADPAKVEVKPTKAPAGDRGGSFKDTKFDKKDLTGGSIKLEVDGKTKKITGRFLGQYYRKPFSIPLEGKLSATDTFELKGKHQDSDIVIKGTHDGTKLDGKINGLVRGKAIDAPFSAQ